MPAFPPAMGPTGDPLTAARLGPVFMILLRLHFTYPTLSPDVTTTECQTQVALPKLTREAEDRGQLPLSSSPTHSHPSENTPPPIAHAAAPAPAGQIQEKDLYKLFPACV